MKRVNVIATACFTAMMAVLALNVAAQDFNTNERTFLTFSAPVELPGVTLQAGTYLFKLADSQSNRHIVQVLSEDEKQIHATILAVPAERLEVTGENVVTFRETAEGATPAVQYWYYPGDRIGHEFVYPKDQATRIAARTGQNVLSAEGDINSSDTRVSSTSPTGETTEWTREGAPSRQAEAPTGAVEGTAGVSGQQPAAQPQQPEAQPETVDPQSESANPETETPPAEPAVAQPTQPAPPAGGTTAMERAQTDERGHSGAMGRDQAVGTSGQAAQTRPSELPRTASALPLSGLIGLLSLGGAFAVRRVRR
jgi:hypothetical protein